MTLLWNLTVWNRWTDTSLDQKEGLRLPWSREKLISYSANTNSQFNTIARLTSNPTFKVSNLNRRRVLTPCSRVILISGTVMSTRNIGYLHTIHKQIPAICNSLWKLRWSRTKISRALFLRVLLIKAQWSLTTQFISDPRLQAETIMKWTKL